MTDEFSVKYSVGQGRQKRMTGLNERRNLCTRFRMVSRVSSILAAVAVWWLLGGVVAAQSITIVDDAEPVAPSDGVYTSGYLLAQLAQGPVTLETGGDSGDPHDIHLAAGTALEWNSPYTLTLAASGTVYLTGTIRHDGPPSGSGGVVILAQGDVQVGTGEQESAVTIGSRHGWTRIAGQNVILHGGKDWGHRAMVGFRAEDVGDNYAVTGPISVTAALTITLLAGEGNFATAQIGHIGRVSVQNFDPDGETTGDIQLEAGHSIFAQAEGGFSANVMVGHGGENTLGTFGGNHTLFARQGDIRFLGGMSYAQVGNGGERTSGNHSGSHTLQAGGEIEFVGGSLRDYAYAQVGNGGNFASGEPHGDHLLVAGGAIRFSGGEKINSNSVAQVGNGGTLFKGNVAGDHTLRAQGDIVFSGGQTRAQVGNGGNRAESTGAGDHTLYTAAGSIVFQAQRGGVQVGNGGVSAEGDQSGNHVLEALVGDIRFLGGEDFDAYAQVGNGGPGATGNHTGNHRVIAHTGEIVFLGGSRPRSSVQIGNGGSEAEGDHGGDMDVEAGGDIRFELQSGDAYAQLGNGGYFAKGNHVGSHRVKAGGEVWFLAGVESGAYAHLGNGGYNARGTHSGAHRLDADGGATFRGGGASLAYAQMGNGGALAGGNHAGNIQLHSAAGDVRILGGDGNLAYGMVGNGGDLNGLPQINISGNLLVRAETGNIHLLGGKGNNAFAQIGNGGFAPNGSVIGSLAVWAEGDVRLVRGSGETAYAMIGNGNGGTGGAGTRAGDVNVVALGELLNQDGRIGHHTGGDPTNEIGGDNSGFITGGNTIVSIVGPLPVEAGAASALQSSPAGIFATGNLLASAEAIFNSAPAVNGGQLRFLVPDLGRIQIAEGALLNGTPWAGSVPPGQLPPGQDYAEPFSFYVIEAPDDEEPDDEEPDDEEPDDEEPEVPADGALFLPQLHRR